MFKGRKLLIVTKHKKERVIAPILEKELGVECVVADRFDTDKLGTFTGEVERQEDPFSTARKKCIYGLQAYDCDLAISSEGSFVSHPQAFFIPMDEEIILLSDLKNKLEISVVERSLTTNFNATLIHTEEELIDFADKAKFPSHALILRSCQYDFIDIRKGINDWAILKKFFSYFIKKFGHVYVETDMRAMYNPTRMEVIEQAAHKLIKKINSKCPVCSTHGFDVVEAKRGLPCKRCHHSTQSIKSLVYKCNHCGFSNEIEYPNEKKLEDPMYCDICNP